MKTPQDAPVRLDGDPHYRAEHQHDELEGSLSQCERGGTVEPDRCARDGDRRSRWRWARRRLHHLHGREFERLPPETPELYDGDDAY